ncbi:hypothetical protein M427DRAFT_53547 [Gonapodya prolifera JEL478]|uniref:Uncharacterized protein n=1 Tax=Gonapodya prolifera (strain JEL478) TaxID=1344416 RepID=A0A139AQ10_GONPJ|nr:hypothetical protein M427DRAFT_53547 [Gonapodya prolifera JEL478]|eukprot:KXS18593.1 hypothetical protein M427DRAFT_53547 [Gonapodya prolifera JEL478]
MRSIPAIAVVAIASCLAVATVTVSAADYTIPTYYDSFGSSASIAEPVLYQRHLDTLNRIFSYTIASNKASILAGRKVPDGTFAANVTGRISPFGRMKDLDDTMDYLYGSFGSNLDKALSLFPAITGVNISAFASTGAVAHANIEFTTKHPTTGATKYIRAQGMFRFADDQALSRVWLYDLYFVNMNAYFKEMWGSPSLYDMIGKACPAIRNVCGNDLNAPYPLVDCEVAFAFKKLGEAAVLADDNVLCRAFETNLVPLRKSVHCGNLGPSGGSRCTAFNYTRYFEPIGPSFTDIPSPSEPASRFNTYNEIKATVFNIYNLTIFPNNLEIISSGKVPPRTFSNNSGGRIWPIGTFENTEDTVEYQFGIFGSQNSSNVAAQLIPVIHEFTIHAFVQTGNIAATSIDYKMLNTFTKQYYPLRVQGFWRIEPDAWSVSAYDVHVQNTVPFFNIVGLGLPNGLTQPALAAVICISQETACKGANQVYGGSGQPQCFIELTTVKPFGDHDQVEADSIQCRSIHVNLAFFRPEVHCAHVGPTGGGKCVDLTYDSYFTLPFVKPFLYNV